MSGSDYSRALARVAVAQIAELAGFDAAHDSALDILADLLGRFLTNVCTAAHDYAELAGRTHTNTVDALLALEDLGISPEELNVFAGLALQGGSVPFAHPVARYPVLQQQPGAPTFLDRHEPHPGHIPAHLPAFPDVHTYQHTPAFQGHESDVQRQRQAVLASKQQAEAALVRLHQRLATAVTSKGAPGAVANGGGTAAGGGSGGGQPGANPFLAPPVVVDAAAAALPEPAADALGPGGGGGMAAVNGGDDDLGALDFDTGAARRVFRTILSPGAKQPRDQAPGAGAADMMDVEGPAADGAVAEAAAGETEAAAGAGQWLIWTRDAAPAAAAAAAAGAPDGGPPRQDMLQLQWHDPGKAASVLGAAARQRPPDAYQQRAEAAMAAEGAVGGGRQRKSAYGRGNAELQRADELLRSGHGGGGGGVGAMFGLLDDDDL